MDKKKYSGWTKLKLTNMSYEETITLLQKRKWLVAGAAR